MRGDYVEGIEKWKQRNSPVDTVALNERCLKGIPFHRLHIRGTKMASQRLKNANLKLRFMKNSQMKLTVESVTLAIKTSLVDIYKYIDK